MANPYVKVKPFALQTYVFETIKKSPLRDNRMTNFCLLLHLGAVVLNIDLH